MSDASLSTPVVLNRPDGSSLTFQRCTPEDRITFRGIFRQYRKAWLRQSLEIADVPRAEWVPFFNALDRTRLHESDVVAWLNEPEGQHEAILLSLRHDQPGATLADVYALDLSDDDKLTVAAGVMNIPLVSRKEGQERPLAGGTGTGAATPTSSGDSPDAPIPSDSPSTYSDAT